MTADPRAFSIEAAAVTDRGLSEKRPENEDSMLSDPAHRIFAVADGVGGAQAGEVASQTAIEVLQEAFANQHAAGEDVEDLMEIAIQRANDSIYRMSREQPRFAMMATTIVALHLDGLRATVGHVGDSRLYRLAPDGRLSRETEDHSLVEEEMRAGRLTPEQAATHPNRNVISRALGAEAAVEVDMRSFEVERGTIFLLCSDGITRHVPDAELSTVLRNARTLEAACEELKRRCFERGAEDNLTAVVVRVGGEGDARAPTKSRTKTRPSSASARTCTPRARSPTRPSATSGGPSTPAPRPWAWRRNPPRSRRRAPRAAATRASLKRHQRPRKPHQTSARRRAAGGAGCWRSAPLLLTLGAVALAFYVGMMFERKGMSSRVIPAATATPTPVARAHAAGRRRVHRDARRAVRTPAARRRSLARVRGGADVHGGERPAARLGRPGVPVSYTGARCSSPTASPRRPPPSTAPSGGSTRT